MYNTKQSQLIFFFRWGLWTTPEGERPRTQIKTIRPHQNTTKHNSCSQPHVDPQEAAGRPHLKDPRWTGTLKEQSSSKPKKIKSIVKEEASFLKKKLGIRSS
jgi:hypothetical protein